jgi:riboflavin kinase/FMN adenylyltransferase
VITTGSFDGVHIGHMAIIKRLNARAQEHQAESVLITFSPHPRKVLYPDSVGKELLMINSPSEKIELLKATGLDHLVILEFTLEFSRISSGDFVRNILADKLNAIHVIVGFNHQFGNNRTGNLMELLEIVRELGFTVEEIPEQDIQDETVSSTKIRKAIKEGYIQRANAYLNHHYSIESDVEFQDHPVCSANYAEVIPSGEDKLLPPPGAYAAHINLKDSPQKGKAVFIIKKKSYCIFPLGDAFNNTKGKIAVRLFKRLDTKEVEAVDCSVLSGYVEEIGELIY